MSKGIVMNRSKNFNRAGRDNPLNPELPGEAHDSDSEYLLSIEDMPKHSAQPLPCSDYYSQPAPCMKTILEEAQSIVEGQRRSDYGNARDCFNRIAKMWSGYLDIELNAFDVANLMITLKVCRAHGKGFQRDSYTDIAGYAYCAEVVYNLDQKQKVKNNEMETTE